MKITTQTYRNTQIFSLPLTQNQAFVFIPASSPMGSLIPSNQHLAVVKCPIRIHLYWLWPIRLRYVTRLRYCLYSSLVFAVYYYSSQFELSLSCDTSRVSFVPLRLLRVCRGPITANCITHNTVYL